MRRQPPTIRRARLVRRTSPVRSRVVASNPERQARRRRAYKARLAKSDWQKKRLATFKRDGWRCVRVVGGVRCPNGRENGTALHCNHRTYARFGHELPEDLETLCDSCDAFVTATTRPNWM